MDFSSHRRPPHAALSGFRVSPSAELGLSPVAAPAAARVSPAQLRAVLDAMPQLVWLTDVEGSADYGNSTWQEFTGSTATTGGWLQWLHPQDCDGARQLWEQSLSCGSAFQGEYRLRHHSGEYRWHLMEARFQRQAGHSSGLWFLTGYDIHARVQAQQELAASALMQKNMLDVSVDCIKLLRTDGTLIHMNKSGCEALGVDPKSGFGQRWLPLLPPEVREKGKKALQQAIRGKNARFAGMSVLPGMAPMHWDNILTPLIGSDGKVTSILCVSRDITLQRQAEIQLREVGEHDALTGLPNRRAFNTRLKQLLRSSRDGKATVGLMLLDLDHFKHINDTLGHTAGDHLLRVLSRRLKQCLPDNGMVARLGGDEFAIVLGPLNSQQDLQEVAHTVLSQINAPITYSGRLINGGMSIGCALFPQDARDASLLMKSADTALNDLKSGGRGGILMFNNAMLLAAQAAALQLECARQILRLDSITPYFQPKVSMTDDQVVGFEALLRWQDEQGQLQLPATVCAAFSDYELASRIGEVMRTKVLEQLCLWREQGLPMLPVSLNASPVEFMRDDYAERLLAHLERLNLPTGLIEVEVTEHMLGERGSDYVKRALSLLKHQGVRIALDDFGTGQSSLAHLRDYPVDCVKIDKDFVQRIEHEPTIRAIIQAVGHLGPSLHLDLVAEGVETEAQRHMLQDCGYQIGQGFLFGEAMSAEQVKACLRQLPRTHAKG